MAKIEYRPVYKDWFPHSKDEFTVMQAINCVLAGREVEDEIHNEIMLMNKTQWHEFYLGAKRTQEIIEKRKVELDERKEDD